MIVILIALLTLGALFLKHNGTTWFGLQEVETQTILLIGGFTLMASLLWRMHYDRNTSYDALDMLMDKGRASLEAHITIIMAGVSIWWIVSQTIAGKDVSERMIDVLMIFVIYRGVKKGIDAYSDKPSSQPVDQEIQQQVVVTPGPPAIPIARQVRPVKATKMTAAKTPMKTATGKSMPKEA